MLIDFRRKLVIRHLVCRFQLDHADMKFLALDALAEFVLGFTRAKNQERVDSTQASNNFVVVFLAMVFDLVLSPIFRKKIVFRVRGRRLERPVARARF